MSGTWKDDLDEEEGLLRLIPPDEVIDWTWKPRKSTTTLVATDVA